MSNRTRRMEALRNLAERPGTEAEGKLARERLAAMEAEGREKPKTAIFTKSDSRGFYYEGDSPFEAFSLFEEFLKKERP